MKHAAVSVILPVYNSAQWLAAALDSVLAQDFSDFECLCGNDGSTDGSLDMLRGYAGRDARIRVIDLPANRGAGPARNEGLRAATGRFVCFMDPDDTLPPDSLSSRLSLLLEYDSDAVRGGCTIRSGGTRTVKIPCEGIFPNICPCGTDGDNSLNDAFFFHALGDHCCFLFRRDILINNRILYGKLFNSHEDVLFLMKLFFIQKKVTFLGKSIYFYNYVNEKSLSNSSIGIERFYAVLYIMKIFYDLAKNNNKIRYADSAFAYYMQYWVGVVYNCFANGHVSDPEVRKMHEELHDLDASYDILARLEAGQPQYIVLKPLQGWFVKLLQLLRLGRHADAQRLARSVGVLSRSYAVA
ncbi:MAG: glycosyltransferase family 2 protein [Desulfovibrio sp.]|nr:glycosyltransferase family 2 protein [Desulfovibrio sp.]